MSESSRGQDKKLGDNNNPNTFSVIEHHISCSNPIKGDPSKRTTKPIYGNEVYHVGLNEEIQTASYDERYHLVLLAKTQEGLENLFNISSHAGMNKVKGRIKEFQVTSMEHMRKHGKGVIALSACMGGKLGRLLINGDYEEAKKFAIEMNEVFDEFFLELQPHDEIPEQLIINEGLININKDTGIRMVITSDSHYVYEEEKKYHDLMKQIDHSHKFTSRNHMWTPDELIEWCDMNDVDRSCIENTALIVDSCTANIAPKDPKGLMPSFDCPPGHSEDSYIVKLANDGLKKKFALNKDFTDITEYTTRMYYELDIITQMGFSAYFLILCDWFAWCKENDILLGPGRGSAAGSLVAYLLDITKVDPIKNDLYFERFLNPSRLDEPDVDTDISKVDRARAIEYLKSRYGESHVCQIITFGKYKLKNTIKAVLSSERGFSAEYQNSITKLIPDLIDGETASYELIEDLVKNPEDYPDVTDREYTQATNCYNKLQEVFATNPEVKDAVIHLRGAISAVGIHAGGVVISSKDISKHIPMMKGSDTAVLPICQANMDGIHFLKGLKIDALGLKTLSQIDLCMKLAGIPKTWLDDEDTSNKEVYDFIKDGHTANVFQMHKFTPTKMIKDFDVSDLDGLTSVNAGNRPGPLEKGEDGKSMVDRYVEVAKGGKIVSLDPRIDYIFAPTNGQMWYQEQLMKLGEVMAGYSLGNADLRIRKVIAKKLVEKIPEIRNEFVYGKESLYDTEGKVIGMSDIDSPLCIGAVRNGFDESLALKLFKDMEAFASYCFNRSHSAAYGLVAYRTAWLSKFYPVEWSVSCLTLDSMDGDKDKIISTLNSCKKRGIKILPPHINKSGKSFGVDTLENGEKVVRFGFLAIKDVGKGPADMIEELVRRDGDFTSFENFLDRTVNGKSNKTLREILDEKSSDKKLINPIKKGGIIALMMGGAFDDLEPNRYKLFNEYMRFRKDLKHIDDPKYVETEDNYRDEDSFDLKNKLASELNYLGYYVSQHPLDGPSFPYVDLGNVSDKAFVRVAGILKGYDTAKTKKGDRYYKLKIETKDGTVTGVNVFKRTYDKYPDSIKGLSAAKAKDGKTILIVEGNVSVQFNNISATNIMQIGRKIREDKDASNLPSRVPALGIEEEESANIHYVKDSPLDLELFTEVK